eukprot:scaffold133041_cov31-Tisochrysis_lutea.AAC.1
MPSWQVHVHARALNTTHLVYAPAYTSGTRTPSGMMMMWAYGLCAWDRGRGVGRECYCSTCGAWRAPGPHLAPEGKGMRGLAGLEDAGGRGREPLAAGGPNCKLRGRGARSWPKETRNSVDGVLCLNLEWTGNKQQAIRNPRAWGHIS